MKDPYTDRELLEILTMFDDGKTGKEIAARYGRSSRNAILGIIHRVNKQTDASDPGGVQNGTMPREWWRDGLNVPGRDPL